MHYICSHNWSFTIFFCLMMILPFCGIYHSLGHHTNRWERYQEPDKPDKEKKQPEDHKPKK